MCIFELDMIFFLLIFFWLERKAGKSGFGCFLSSIGTSGGPIS